MRNLFVCVSEEREDGERGEREGEGTQALSLSSGTHRIQNSLTEHTDRLPGVELKLEGRNKNRSRVVYNNGESES